MWIVVHTYVGLAIASVLDLPLWQVALVVLASHVLLDLVPHWDYTGDRGRVLWGSTDLLASLVTVIALPLLGMPLGVAAMGVVSAAPDLDVAAEAMTGRRSRHFFPSHWRSFPHGRCGPALGISLQATIIAVSAAVILSQM